MATKKKEIRINTDRAGRVVMEARPNVLPEPKPTAIHSSTFHMVSEQPYIPSMRSIATWQVPVPRELYDLMQRDQRELGVVYMVLIPEETKWNHNPK